MDKNATYSLAVEQLKGLLTHDIDITAAMATVVSVLHHGLTDFHWTGFYRVTRPNFLTIGPYQGFLGCTVIPFEKGVCGACARSQQPVRVPDVSQVRDHIACSPTTVSEIVVPVFDRERRLRAVLDVDSDEAAAFGQLDEDRLVEIVSMLQVYYD